jgi:hypothetical protein
MTHNEIFALVSSRLSLNPPDFITCDWDLTPFPEALYIRRKIEPVREAADILAFARTYFRDLPGLYTRPADVDLYDGLRYSEIQRIYESCVLSCAVTCQPWTPEEELPAGGDIQ